MRSHILQGPYCDSIEIVLFHRCQQVKSGHCQWVVDCKTQARLCILSWPTTAPGTSPSYLTTHVPSWNTAAHSPYTLTSHQGRGTGRHVSLYSGSPSSSPPPLFFSLLLSYWLSSHIHWLFAFDSLLCCVLCFYLYTKLWHVHNMLEIYAIYSSNINSSFSSKMVTNIVSILQINTEARKGKETCWLSLGTVRDPTLLPMLGPVLFHTHFMLWALHQSHNRSVIMVEKSGFREMVTCPSHTAGREHSKS